MGMIDMNKQFETIIVNFEADICYIKINRPEENNTINDRLIEECSLVLKQCEETAKIVILEGLPEVFCFGADFKEINNDLYSDEQHQDPEPLYDVWRQLACGPFISIAHVRGKANAGGIGFVAACDIVLSEKTAVFSLSELLFGLMPACVLPFLIRRIGYTKAHYMTLMTQPISAKQAKIWGLVDACEEDSKNLLRKHLLRLKKLNKTSVLRYKRYMNNLSDVLSASKQKALDANKEVFGDKANIRKIEQFVQTGVFPWEGE
jgi:polyketide biosynthesis enoyl-CoA hydratase PksH